MKKLVLGSLALAALAAAPAMAADMAVKAPLKAAPPAVYNWTGCYVGANGGWIGGRDTYDLTMAGAFLDPGNFFSIPANRAGLEHSYRSDSSNGTVGAQAGCNYQVSQFVAGVEADANWSGLRETFTAAYGGVNAHTETTGKDLKWFATFRARAGFAWDRILFYGTGGLAVSRIDSNTSVQFGPGGLLANFPFNGQASVDRWGWAAGAGIEWAATANWTFRAEYLYLDFGSFDYLSPCPTNVCIPGPGLPPFAYRTHVRAQENVVRVGVNYKFGGPVVARY